MPRARDYIGQTRHSLTCIDYHKGPGYRYTLDVRCTCGTVKQISTAKFGVTKSCGCQPNPALRHGQSRTALYRRFIGIRNRCNSPGGGAYRYYGARGIRCHWQTFEQFIADMGEPPTPQSTVERINNDGDYCAENCIWADRFVQANHTVRNRYLELNGERLTHSQWAHRIGVDPCTICNRLERGWSIERTLTTPPRPTNPHERRKPQATSEGG